MSLPTAIGGFFRFMAAFAAIALSLILTVLLVKIFLIFIAGTDEWYARLALGGMALLLGLAYAHAIVEILGVFIHVKYRSSL